MFEYVKDHKIWKSIDFWERTITCKNIIFVITVIDHIQQELKSYDSLTLTKGESANDKIQRFNEIVFTKLSHLEHDMLTFNLEKDQIKNLIQKICANAHNFP